MKIKITLIVLTLLYGYCAFPQNTADLFIENPSVNEGQTKFSWEIHITRTNSWGVASGANSLGDCSWAFEYNALGLSNPVLTYSGPVVLPAQGYTNTVEISGGRVIVTTDLDRDNFDGVDLTLDSKTHVYTVEMDIDNTTQESDLLWDQINTGIFTGRSDALVNESYYGTGDILLPVELSLFTATLNQNVINLKWQTKTEVDNYGFEVERKVGGKDQKSGRWSKIGFVPGHGNSNSPKNYTFTDKNPVGGSKFVYRLKQIDSDGKFEYSDEVEIEMVPDKFELFQNYPNPFNPVTNIKFALPKTTKVAINVYNLLGEKVATLLNEDKEAGFYNIQFDASNFSSGVYIFRLATEDFIQTKKMTLIK